LEITLQ